MAGGELLASTFAVCIVLSSNYAASQHFATGPDRDSEVPSLSPTVVVAILARNKEYALPWFLGCIDRLDYPKDRIALWIRTDHNVDSTAEILLQWTNKVQHLYHSVDLDYGEDGGYADENGPSHWSTDRMTNVIALRQRALDKARQMWADYLFMLDCDAFLLNPKVLQLLIQQRRTIIAPMLNTTATYSNFWGAMAANGYYIRSDDYLAIIDRHKLGVFPVPMVNTAFLINLNHRISQSINFSPAPLSYPHSNPDDIIQFAFSARSAGINMHLLNTEFFGLLPRPSDQDDALAADAEAVTYLKLHAIVDDHNTRPSAHVKPVHPLPSKLGFDEIYLINLERRPDRKRRMLASFEELGIKVKYFPAVDGREIDEAYLEHLGVRQLDNYEDPYHKRPLKMGEIGCFLSHYFIWKEVVDLNYSKILIFEDDVRFSPFFMSRFHQTMAEVEQMGYGGEWDLLYLGRKIMNIGDEYIDGYHLAWPGYTYWTISYALSNKGAHKLLAQRPLEKMLPVDEFLPIMFNKHNRPEWLEHFGPRDLVALAAQPVLLTPTHYIGEADYFSDTEDSTLVNGQRALNKQEAGQPGGTVTSAHSEL